MKINIPTKINDITVGEYLKFSELNVKESDEEFLVHKTLNIFCGIPMKDVLNINVNEAADIAKEIFDVLNQKAEFENRFVLEDIEYGFIPNLEDLSLGEYIDLETYLKDEKNLHKVAAVMYRPITKSYDKLYDIESYSADLKRQELMKNAPIGIISQAVVFFYNIAHELLTDSLHSSNQQVKKKAQEIIQQQDNLFQSMDGSTQYISSVKDILETLNQ